MYCEQDLDVLEHATSIAKHWVNHPPSEGYAVAAIYELLMSMREETGWIVFGLMGMGEAIRNRSHTGYTPEWWDGFDHGYSAAANAGAQ